MLQHGRERHHARSRSAEAIVHRIVIGGVGGSDRVQRAIGFGHIKAETHFAQVTRPSAMGDTIKFQRAEFRLGVGQNVFH